jgi:hypothetical protein
MGDQGRMVKRCGSGALRVIAAVLQLFVRQHHALASAAT